GGARAADRLPRMVAGLVVLAAPRPADQYLQRDRRADARWWPDDAGDRYGAGRVDVAAVLAAGGDRLRLPGDGRRHRRVRGVHVRAAAPAGLAGLALRLHQPDHRRGTR